MPSRRKERQRKRASARDAAKRAQAGNRTVFEIPDGVEQFKLPKDGRLRIDHVPYIAGKGNRNTDVGFEWYERTFWWHGGVGPKNMVFVCSQETFGKPCPICEYSDGLSWDDPEQKEEKKSLKPSHRQLFNIYNYDEPDKGIQLFESSYHRYGKKLDDAIKFLDEGDPRENFWYPEAGYSVKLGVSEDKYTSSDGRSNKFGTVSAIEFVEREEQWDSSVLEQTHCLDDLLIETPYDRLKEIFFAEGGGGGGDDEAGGDAEVNAPLEGQMVWFYHPQSGERLKGKTLGTKGHKVRLKLRDGSKIVVNLADLEDSEVPF